MTHYCREVKTRRNISDQLTQTSDNHLNTTTPPKCATVAGHMTNQKIFDNKMPKAPGKDMEWASVAGMGFQLTLVRAAGGSGCWWVGVVGSGDLSATTTHRPPVRSRFLAPPPLPPPPPTMGCRAFTCAMRWVPPPHRGSNVFPNRNASPAYCWRQ